MPCHAAKHALALPINPHAPAAGPCPPHSCTPTVALKPAPGARSAPGLTLMRPPAGPCPSHTPSCLPAPCALAQLLLARHRLLTACPHAHVHLARRAGSTCGRPSTGSIFGAGAMWGLMHDACMPLRLAGAADPLAVAAGVQGAHGKGTRSTLASDINFGLPLAIKQRKMNTCTRMQGTARSTPPGTACMMRATTRCSLSLTRTRLSRVRTSRASVRTSTACGLWAVSTRCVGWLVGKREAWGMGKGRGEAAACEYVPNHRGLADT